MSSSETDRTGDKPASAGGDCAAREGIATTGTSVDGAVIREVDRLTVWVLTDNSYDALIPDEKVARRFRAGPGKSIHAEHGIAFYVETQVDGHTRTCMFDFGLDPAGVAGNMALLGLDVAKTDVFALSHGHYDHYSGAVRLLQAVQPVIRPGTPFYVGAEAFNHRYSLRPGDAEPTDLGQLDRDDVEALGVRIIEVGAATEIIPGAYLTGPIERRTLHEQVAPGYLVRRGEKLEHDNFAGEQALVAKVKGRGIVVLSGCSHAGIVNTVLQARRLAGTDKVHAILGGFHLSNSGRDRIDQAVADIRAMAPDYVMPSHCTGFEAETAFRTALPGAFILKSAGTRYTFNA